MDSDILVHCFKAVDGRKDRIDDEQQLTLADKAAPMTYNGPRKLHEAKAALRARFASTQLLVSKVDLGPYLNQARSVP
jgi:hypothetical protein